MFLKSAGFKRLIKESYSGPGLRMGNDGDIKPILEHLEKIEIAEDVWKSQ